jgi:hypothetical protein
MWIISVLPEWVVHAIFGIGVLGVIAGFVLGFVPLINRYKLPVQIISIIVLVLGVYLEGGLADYREWQYKAQQLEVKVAEAEARAAQKNVEVQEKVVTQVQVVRQKGQDIVKYIDREVVKKEEVVKFVEKCPVPQDLIDAHNKAVDELNSAAEKKK